MQQPLLPLSAVAGKPFSEWVPEETFVDFEDGDTPDLHLHLMLPEPSAEEPPAQGWLAFSTEDQRFYGM